MTLARSMSLARTSSLLARQPLSQRTFAFSATARLGLKESASQTDADYDKHKRDSLDKQRRGAGHWKPELASDSEEAVRADRGFSTTAGSEKAAGQGVKEMQERTKRAAEETSKAGTSMRDGM